MSRQQDNYIYQQLEPTDVIITGNAKRYGLLMMPPRKRLVDRMPVQPVELEAESNRKQDEYLAAHGVNL